MKSKFIFPFIIAAILAITTITACTKQGTQGLAGTANVIYSNWNPLTSLWRDSTLSNIDSCKVNYIDVPFLDSLMLTKAEVKVFINLSASRDYPYVKALPIIKDTTNDLTDFVAIKSKIIIYMKDITKDTLSAVQPWTGDVDFRYIIIPGGTLATARAQQEDYYSLCKRLDIPE